MDKALANGKLTFDLAWKRASKYNAIPRWAKSNNVRRKILAIYVYAQSRNLKTGKKHQVDHIIPLYHPYICGLHVPNNLQVLTKDQNQRKSNVFYCYRQKGNRKYYAKESFKDRKIPKIHNQTKKNPRKLAKRVSKRVSTFKNR